MPDSNPGPLPQKFGALLMSHHIYNNYVNLNIYSDNRVQCTACFYMSHTVYQMGRIFLQFFSNLNNYLKVEDEGLQREIYVLKTDSCFGPYRNIIHTAARNMKQILFNFYVSTLFVPS